jgi:ABC-type transport system substrate-binding protein
MTIAIFFVEENMKRFLVIVVMCCLATALAFAGGQQPGKSGNVPNATPGGKILVAGLAEDFGGLEPYSVEVGSKIYWRPAVYEQLFTQEEFGGTPVPCIGKSFTKIDDTTTEVEIFNSVYDSEGNHITADDVVFSYRHAKECGTVSKMALLASIEKTGDYKVRIKSSNASLGTFESVVTRALIVSQKAFEASPDGFATKSCGTGPYVISNYIPSSTLELTRRDYWQKDNSQIPPSHKPNAEKVTYKFISDPAQLVIALENKEIDCITYLAGNGTNYFLDDTGKAKPGYTSEGVLDSLVYVLFLNMSNGGIVSNNLKLREAILYAVNSNELLKAAIDGRGEICHTFGSRKWNGYLNKWTNEDYFNYNPDIAKQLVKESGFDTTKPIRLLTMNVTPWKELGELVQAYCLNIGLNIQVLAYDAALYGEYKTNPAQWDMKFENINSHDYVYSGWQYALRTGAGDVKDSNANFNNDPKLQELLVQASTIAGNTEGNRDAVHKYLVQGASLKGLINRMTYSIGRSDRIKNIYFDGTGKPLVWSVDFAGN